MDWTCPRALNRCLTSMGGRMHGKVDLLNNYVRQTSMAPLAGELPMTKSCTPTYARLCGHSEPFSSDGKYTRRWCTGRPHGSRSTKVFAPLFEIMAGGGENRLLEDRPFSQPQHSVLGFAAVGIE